MTGGSGTSAALRGEAVAVDMPGGQVLFALLKTQRGDDLVDVSLRTLDAAYDYDRVESAKRIGSMNSTPAAVPPELYPMLVTFRDKSKPASVEPVEPTNLAAHFGSGVRLRGITAEVTNDAVAKAIEQRLAWLPTLRGHAHS